MCNFRYSSSMFVFGLLLLVLLTSPDVLLAQDYEDDPEEAFFSLLDQGYDLDDARAMIAQDFDMAVATELAVWICFEYVSECEESQAETDVLSAWATFLNGLDEGYSISELVDGMQEYFDPYLSTGVAMFWCSPEPESGCSTDDYYTYAWIAFDSYLSEGYDPAEAIGIIAENSTPYVAELVAAANCGEATCYADFFEEFEDGAAPVIDDFEVNEMQVTKDRQAGASFANNPGRPKKGWKEKLKCKIRGGKNC